MTRDGAVLDNQTTGEEIHISERDAEKQLSPDGQSVQMGKVRWSFWLVSC